MGAAVLPVKPFAQLIRTPLSTSRRQRDRRPAAGLQNQCIPTGEYMAKELARGYRKDTHTLGRRELAPQQLVVGVGAD
jgi:hypothetical protein